MQPSGVLMHGNEVAAVVFDLVVADIAGPGTWWSSSTRCTELEKNDVGGASDLCSLDGVH